MDWQLEIYTSIVWLFQAWGVSALGLLFCAWLISKSTLGGQFWRITKPCMDLSSTAKTALLVGLLLFFVLLEVKISVLNTKFYNELYSAMQDKKADVFWFFAFLNAILVGLKVIQEIIDTLIGQTFEIRWLEKLNGVLLRHWLSHKNYYRLHFLGDSPDNIDQRIEQDAREFVTTTVQMMQGVVNAVISIIEYTIILWGLSGVLTLMGISVPKGAVFFIFGFIIIATVISVWIGRPLIGLNFNKEKLHGDYRYSLIRLQDNAESIAFYDGESQEKRTLSARFNAIILNRWAIVRRMLGLDGFNTGITQGAMLLPLMIQAPRFFAGDIKIGDMHQTVQSFNRLMRALSFFRLFYEEFTLYQARLKRLYGFLNRMDSLDDTPLSHAKHSGDTLTLEHFTLIKSDGVPLISPISLSLHKGERLLIQGTSGTGKTMLLKAMAGICPFAMAGTLTLPVGRALFIPQRAYVPQGTLRDALCYPDLQTDDQTLMRTMIACKLDKWVHSLDIIDDWQATLSLGELQRVAFVRVFLSAPDVLYLDESTSALDEPTEDLMYHQIINKLPHAIVVSVGHRSTLHKYHQKQIILTQTLATPSG